VKKELEKDCEFLSELLKKLKLDNVGCVIGRELIPVTTRLTDLERHKLPDSNIYIRLDDLTE